MHIMKKQLILLLAIVMITACSNEKKSVLTVEEAVKNGNVVIELGNNKSKTSNLENIIRFMKNVEAKKADEVQIDIFQKNSLIKKNVDYDGTEFVINEEKNGRESVYTCKNVVDWSGQYLANDCVENGKPVNGAVRLFEVSLYEHNKAIQKIRLADSKD